MMERLQPWAFPLVFLWVGVLGMLAGWNEGPLKNVSDRSCLLNITSGDPARGLQSLASSGLRTTALCLYSLLRTGSGAYVAATTSCQGPLGQPGPWTRWGCPLCDTWRPALRPFVTVEDSATSVQGQIEGKKIQGEQAQQAARIWLSALTPLDDSRRPPKSPSTFICWSQVLLTPLLGLAC